MTAYLEVLDCGPVTSLQDGGRTGFSRIGLPVSGAMDRRSLAAANALVGNARDTAAVEFALSGGEFVMRSGTALLAWCGGRAAIHVDGQFIMDHAAFRLRDGQLLRIGRLETGVYGYLAVAGGFDVGPVLGSCSLDRRARIGSIAGRPFRCADHLPLKRDRFAHDTPLLAVEPCVDPRCDTFRVLLGPQDSMFTPESLHAFSAGVFRVTGRADRMAYVLDGPVLRRSEQRELVSEPTMPGSIQVPPDGQPIVLMADRQTIGGYPKIATVVSPDLGRLAQRRPGEAVRFAPVTLAAARAAVRAALASPLARRGGNPAAHMRLDLVSEAAVSAVDQGTWDY